MLVTVSNKGRIHAGRDTYDCLAKTIKIYNQVIAYLIPVIQNNWNDIKKHEYANQQQQHIERLVHARKNHPADPRYTDFDQKFNQLPSYLRRDAINTALGDYKSWQSNHDNWLESDQKTKEPKLQLNRHHAPSFYKDNMSRRQTSSFRTIELKVFDGKNWVWRKISIKKKDADYLLMKSQLTGVKTLSPTIKKEGPRWYVTFAFQFSNNLVRADVFQQRICAVDLGVNTDATCCVMEPDGTIVAREFIRFATEKARLYRQFNKLRKAQSRGAKRLKKMWHRISNLNEELVRKTVRAIIDFAIKYSCTHVVCEFLNMKGKLRGSRKYRLKLWRKREVYHRLLTQAHSWGMRVSQVCAWGTSRLAFDGSGRVERGRGIVDPVTGESLGYSCSWVRFASGKLYHSDLNAAYNIGARYYVREILKNLSGETHGSVDLANVLDLPGGSNRVLSDLISLSSALRNPRVLEALAAVAA